MGGEIEGDSGWKGEASMTEVAAGNIARLDVLRGTERKLVEVVIGEAAA